MEQDGQPLDGAVDLVFVLYDDAIAGSAVWSESLPSVGVVAGRLQVVLGTVAPLTPSVLNGVPMWLSITVNGSTTLSPRARIHSIPYAVRSDEAHSIEGLTAAEIPTKGELLSGSVPIEWSALQNAPVPALSCSPTDVVTWTGQLECADITSIAGPHFTSQDAVDAMGPLDDGNPLHHDRYTDAEAVSAMGVKSNANPLHHDRYTDAEARAAAGIPSGFVGFFNAAACPVGWTDRTADWAGRYIVGKHSADTAGTTIGAALTAGESRAAGAHTHGGSTGVDGGHTHDRQALTCTGGGSSTQSWNRWNSASQSVGCISPTISAEASSSTHSHALTTNSGSGLAAGTNAPYVRLLICEKI